MTGARNLITDVPGILVGQADNPQLRSGVTVVLPEGGSVGAVDVRGGGPGTRETDALGLDGTVDAIHGVVLSGGSAFGLAAASAVQRWLAARGDGFAVGDARVPIVPAAVLFDLLNGGEKSAVTDGDVYGALGVAACEAASRDVTLGTVGAGYGATTARFAGGLGSASAQVETGATVGAIAAVNPVGCVTLADDAPDLWAQALEQDGEFLSCDVTLTRPAPASPPALKGIASRFGDGPKPGANTTLAVVATDAMLDTRQCRRLAIMAQAGLARAIAPVHTPLDGDVVFALSTGQTPAPRSPAELALLGAQAANVLARAITRGVCHGDPDGTLRPDARSWRQTWCPPVG
ncbi:MAG: P1 family peptidase [Pseudomonadota bacterium]